jgi:CRP-like cAMP-binding protein
MTELDTSLSPLLDRLMLRVDLTQADQDAVLTLPQTVRPLKRGEHFIREGAKPAHCCLMLSGFTVRYKVLAHGARQIIGIHMKGDMVDLQNVLLERSDHDVQALTAATVVIIPRDALEELAFARPPVGKALWLETLVDGSLFREWIANVGRRDARARIAHLLCEFAIRLEAAGLAATSSYELPMTQEQLGDTLGLTSVHVNRTLMALAEEGLIEREQRLVRISDWKKLTREAGFDPSYLHLPKSDGMRFR